MVRSDPMRKLLTRLAMTLPVVWLVVSLVFFLIHLVPGDPIDMMLGDGASLADRAALRHDLGLDQALGAQYVHYWNGVLHGDLGVSIRLHETVSRLIFARYPYTLALTLTALAVALALAMPAGVFAAVRRGKWADQALSVVSLFRLSVPGLVLGPAFSATSEAGRWLASRLPAEGLAAALGVPALPERVLRLDPALPFGDERDLDLLPNTLPPQRHLGYAVQWFGLALTVLVVVLVLEWRRRRAAR